MKSRDWKSGLVWGGLLILFGAAFLVERYTDASASIWVTTLIIAGFIPFAVYLTDRSNGALLIPTYVFWAVAGMLALIVLGVLDDEAVAVYALFATALPFLIVGFRDRAKRWPFIIPGAILVVVGMVFLIAEAAFEYIGALALVLVGVWILVRALGRKKPSPEAQGPPHS